MAGSRPCHGDKVKQRCVELLKQGTSVANIAMRLGVSKSYVKREREKLKGLAPESHGDDD
jgi:transposase-like protein